MDTGRSVEALPRRDVQSFVHELIDLVLLGEGEDSVADPTAELTPREREILELLVRGYRYREIGDRLFISPKTVDTYKQRIHEKVGLSHRAEYVQFALRLGLLTNT